MHISVLLEESIRYLNLTEDSVIVDATLGYGGHSSNILTKIPKGFLYAFDQDKDAIKEASKKLARTSSNYEIINTNFVNIKDELNKRNIKPDGILFDLGVSSPQLDNAERGFSFHKDAKLDMRMNRDDKLTAYEIVNEYSYEQLTDIFYKYGEEKYANSIAKAIIQYRNTKKIESTLELAEIIKDNVPEKYRRQGHPARKVFQAIRIEVNNELEVFKTALTDALDLVKPGGRICVITFHSLEDRICKQIFNEVSSIPKELRKLPVIPEEYKPKFKVVANIEPSNKEIEENVRSRSARLRVIERVNDYGEKEN
ncbi:MAG: 16S rRNA (cytosine(1402)-N(4))-methyltransferase RsmH [Bacilli bacterium]|nr:16S rRNA (cytosine(1402)-N(4))-methyltransferase RsmH [Bacilli bacterium]